MSGEVWEQVYDRLAELIEAHRTTLIFVNTRRLAERVTRQLSERLGEEHVTAHHGSLAKEQRLDAEQRLKRGELKALVATASLELGIDIGDVDLVCQLGSPRSIASFLQRVGRSGHAVDGTPKGPAVPALARRARRMRGADRQRAARRARPADDAGAAARRAGAADRRRSRRAGMERGRALRAAPPRLAVSRAAARGFRRRGGHAGGRLQHPPRPARRAHPSRRGQPHAARPARRAADRADLRRHHPRQRRLPGAARAGEPRHRHGERGFRGREHGRRRLPARQHELSHPARRARRGARRGRRTAWRRPFRSGWARRRAAATSFRYRCRACAPSSPRAARPTRPAKRALRWLTDEIGIDEAAAAAAGRISGRRACRARLPADPATRWCSSASSTKPAACSW